MFKKTQWIIVIFVAVGFLVIGYVLSYLENNLTTNSVGGVVRENTFQAGWDAAKERLASSGFAGGGAMMDVRNLNGEITEISGNTITLKIRPLEPLADVSLDTRTIIVTDQTKMYISQAKDPKQYQTEMDAYNKSMKASINIKTPLASATSASTVQNIPIMPPQGFEKVDININDLKVGQLINIVAEENIRDTKSFNATEIISYQAAMPVAPINPTAPASPIK